MLRHKKKRNQNICIICNCCILHGKLQNSHTTNHCANVVTHAQTLRGASRGDCEMSACQSQRVASRHCQNTGIYATACCFCLTNIKLVNFACERNQSITPSTHKQSHIRRLNNTHSLRTPACMLITDAQHARRRPGTFIFCQHDDSRRPSSSVFGVVLSLCVSILSSITS